MNSSREEYETVNHLHFPFRLPAFPAKIYFLSLLF